MRSSTDAISSPHCRDHLSKRRTVLALGQPAVLTMDHFA